MGQLLFTTVRDNVSTIFETTLPDSDLDRIAYAYRSLYFSSDGIFVPEVPAELDANDNVIVEAVPAYYREVTQGDVVTKIANVLLQSIKDTTKEFERNLAARSAIANVSTIQTSDITIANT